MTIAKPVSIQEACCMTTMRINRNRDMSQNTAEILRRNRAFVKRLGAAEGSVMFITESTNTVPNSCTQEYRDRCTYPKLFVSFHHPWLAPDRYSARFARMALARISIAVVSS